MRSYSSGVIVFVALALLAPSPVRDPCADDSTQSAGERGPAVARAPDGGGLAGLLALALTSAPLLDPRPAPALSTPEPLAIEQAVLLKTTQTSSFSPPSPDPSGLAYDPTTNRLILVDGEVEEMTIFAGVNLYEATLGGALAATGDTMDYSIEPVGLAFNVLNKHLFVSDDDAREVYEVAAGGDGQYGTSDDVVTHFDTVVFGCDDPEGIAYDSASNALFLIDGIGRKVFRVGAGPNGKFDGVPSKGGDDVTSQFDVAPFGPQDPEGITWNPGSGTLYIVDEGADLIVETTTAGALVRTISLAQANLTGASAIEFAPGSSDPSAWHVYITSRGADNDSDPNENDGRLYELSISGVSAPGNAAPFVSAGPDQTAGIVGGAVLDGLVADDGLPDPPGALTTTWSQVSGPGTVGFGSAASVDTSASFSATGTYVLRLTADDGELAGSDELTVTVVSGSVGLLEVPVAASSDDAEESALGVVTLNSSDLELVQDSTLQTVGLRFASVAVPQGSLVPVAAIQFQADEVHSGATALLIQGQAIDNAPTFTTATGNVSSRARTSASVVWTPPPWPVVGEAGFNQQTVDISPVIQELVNRPGWSAGNAIAIIITGSGKRVATAYNGSPAGAPRLRVQHGAAPAGNQAPAVGAGPDQSVELSMPADLDGTVSDDGLPVPPGALTMAWSAVSGPGTVTFANAGAADTSATFSQLGTYVLRLSASDGALAASDELTVSVTPDNQAPVVLGGPDLVVAEDMPVLLDGTVTDDGLPDPPGALTTTWAKASGAGGVSFADAGAVDTLATFNKTGTFVVRLTANDGAQSASDEVVVSVVSGNLPPVVDAGPDQSVSFDFDAVLDGTASDDGLPPPASLTTLWTQLSGPGAVGFGNAAATDTSASFPAPGTYVLQLAAGDGALQSTDSVTITVTPGLFVDLGGGAPGVAGLPTLTAKGPLTPGSTLTVSLQHAAPGAPMLLWMSFASVPVSVFGGTIYAYPPAFQTLLVTGPGGSFTSSIAWPAGIASGTAVYLQFLIRDVTVGVTPSNAVTAVAP